ncbi:hypothetical protein DOTSEDRAFT_71086 [Dothistroma septosporum NZE10]|uniref:Uncharacterized protein n=1 Tax=Dothistroma septosporum (strain NZE10 / CBS 128990) TaxID=675120 RepID=N1PS65_DOTSN|nr:hypothetical protein DOTSEDRAFT_71086 [Dothistroma septosporum NZE10]
MGLLHSLMMVRHSISYRIASLRQPASGVSYWRRNTLAGNLDRLADLSRLARMVELTPEHALSILLSLVVQWAKFLSRQGSLAGLPAISSVTSTCGSARLRTQCDSGVRSVCVVNHEAENVRDGLIARTCFKPSSF